MEPKFIKINAEKALFLCEKLGISVIPTICLIKNGKVVHVLEGFTELGNTDDFKTATLEKVLEKYGILKSDDEENDPLV